MDLQIAIQLPDVELYRRMRERANRDPRVGEIWRVARLLCPVCSTGHLIPAKRGTGRFYGCNRYRDHGCPGTMRGPLYKRKKYLLVLALLNDDEPLDLWTTFSGKSAERGLAQASALPVTNEHGRRQNSEPRIQDGDPDDDEWVQIETGAWMPRREVVAAQAYYDGLRSGGGA